MELEDKLREQLYRLFETDKYVPQLNKDVIDIDVNDLPDEIRESLTENFIRNEYRKNIQECLKETLDPLPVPVISYFKGPKRKVREISSDDIGKLRTVNGIIISVKQPRSFIRKACFWCPECGERMYQDQYSAVLRTPSNCFCGNKQNLTLIEEKSEWDDYQELRLQENPEEIEIGAVPRWLKVVMIDGHLMDTCQPGDMVNLSCILRIDQNKKRKDRVFAWYFQVVGIDVLTKDAYSTQLTDEDISEILEWSKKENIIEIIINSVYPSIYGCYEEKYGVTLSLFGGVEKRLPDILFRGQPHCLLIGDPSTAKTAIIQAASRVAPKGIYTQAGGASGVGLTAAAIKYGDEWVLEAGAVVLTNGGTCCIDELEKMSKEDRKKILECMGIQTVTVHKANIHVTLNAKTSILAAANPKYGTYDPRYTVAENINLPSPILARFDLIYIMRDIPEEERDSKIADKIMQTVTSEGVDDLVIMPHNVIKKYILYAKQIKPTIKPRAKVMLKDFYKQIRAEAYEDAEHKPIPITPRQMQGLIRLTQANARMKLKREADLDDAEVAIELVMNTLRRAALDPSTGLLDTTGLEHGVPKSKTDKRKVIEQIIPVYPSQISRKEIYEQCGSMMTDEIIGTILYKLIVPGSNFTESGGMYSKVIQRG